MEQPVLPTGNGRVRIRAVDVLSDDWYVLRRATFDYRMATGAWVTQQREAYDRGNGATVLLFNRQRRTVALTRQFRIPTYLNEHPDGMMIEAPAGLLDADDAVTAIRREVAEETGYRIRSVERIFDLYMSPGSVTERVAFFAAEYDPRDRVARGGGVEVEGEDIEVLEVVIDDAVSMVGRAEIVDAKTVLLLQWAQLSGVLNP